jgi:phosphate transport system substrate-binding protein
MARVCFAALVFIPAAHGQTATSLKNVRKVYVGSLGSDSGADELKRELIHNLGRGGHFTVVSQVTQADAVIDGKGELWVKGYHSLSPRARVNPSYAEPLHDGYLSVKLHGKDDEILWSYFADPRRISFRELKRDLADEVVSELTQDREEEMAPPAPAPNANDVPASLRGAGATFPFPLYQDWFKSFHARHPAWSFDYAGMGSDAGITELAAGRIDFAGSDIPPAALGNRIPQSANAFPTVGGAVVLIYNLPGVSGELRLTADLIAAIFSGTIRTWNDPALTAINPSVPLPATPIATFHRSDGSGTTYAFTEYLSKVDEKWRAKNGAAASIAWADGTGADGNEGLAKSVAETPYSIGYVEFIYAFENHLSFVAVRNLAGRFVHADLLSIMAAANGAGEKEQYLSLSITNSRATAAYPISTFSWVVAPNSLDPAKRTAFRAFIEWMLTSGQRQCSALGYAPLPKNLVDLELSAIRKPK